MKRMLREAVRLHTDLIPPGWDVVLIARRGIDGADYLAVEDSVTYLLGSAGLFGSTPGAATDEGD